jgi:hypothetical protein
MTGGVLKKLMLKAPTSRPSKPLLARIILPINSSHLQRYGIPELVKTKGYLVFLSSEVAQLRVPTGSAGSIAKHATNRLAEFVVSGTQ